MNGCIGFNSEVIRGQARKLASLVVAIISIKLAWGHVTQLYTRNLYHILNNVAFFNCWVTVGDDEALDKLIFWKDLPRLIFESDIWPSTTSLSILFATCCGRKRCWLERPHYRCSFLHCS